MGRNAARELFDRGLKGRFGLGARADRSSQRRAELPSGGAKRVPEEYDDGQRRGETPEHNARAHSSPAAEDDAEEPPDGENEKEHEGRGIDQAVMEISQPRLQNRGDERVHDEQDRQDRQRENERSSAGARDGEKEGQHGKGEK
jgi:hypothetical protein